MLSIFVDNAYAMAGGGAGAEGGGGIAAFMPLILMFVIFYFLLIRPQQKRAKEHQAMLAAIDRGDEVVTSGGIIGRVTGVTDDVLTIEIAKDVRVRVQRSGIAGKVVAGEPKK